MKKNIRRQIVHDWYGEYADTEKLIFFIFSLQMPDPRMQWPRSREQ